MKKIDLGQTITILANVGVIAGIVFLGFEMRQNTVAVQSEASHGIQEQIGAIYEMLNDDSTMDIFLKGMEDPSSLTGIALGRFNGLLTMQLQAYQNLYLQVSAGAYDQRLADGWWQLLRDTFESRGMQEHWDTRGFILSQQFREFVETEVMTRQPTDNYSILSIEE